MTEMPANACDCHMHIFGPQTAYPLRQDRSYTPPEASLDDYRAVMDSNGIKRVVLVQPSPYGADNRCMLDAMQQLGDRARGVAVIAADIDDNALSVLDAAAVRGARLILNAKHTQSPEILKASVDALATRLRGTGWHIEVEAPLPVTLSAVGVLLGSETPIVLGHMARMSLDGPSETLRQLEDLLAGDHVWMKLSGIDRMTKSEADFEQGRETVTRLLSIAASDRLLWGSDWPHTGYHQGGANADAPLVPFRPIEYGNLLRWFWTVVATTDDAKAILELNPARLYSFDATS